jgi:hypothetical protein
LEFFRVEKQQFSPSHVTAKRKLYFLYRLVLEIADAHDTGVYYPWSIEK